MKPIDEAITQANTLMVTRPQVLAIELQNINGRHTYNWRENDSEAKKIRREIKKILSHAWQAGNYNYQQFAEKMRVDVLSIQALLDEDFLFNYPHLK